MNVWLIYLYSDTQIDLWLTYVNSDIALNPWINHSVSDTVFNLWLNYIYVEWRCGDNLWLMYTVIDLFTKLCEFICSDESMANVFNFDLDTVFDFCLNHIYVKFSYRDDGCLILSNWYTVITLSYLIVLCQFRNIDKFLANAIIFRYSDTVFELWIKIQWCICSECILI